MFLAEEAAQTASRFQTFDVFVILFTIVLAIALLRLLAAPIKNKFAIGFAAVSLITFVFMDVLMVKHWLS
ncbi:MAG: hypothetical protein K0R67_1613 [Paenibacillus sp.]|jgi:hypothetical protein|nr:hypothetical protein [Paenibacillus sp.]